MSKFLFLSKYADSDRHFNPVAEFDTSPMPEDEAAMLATDHSIPVHPNLRDHIMNHKRWQVRMYGAEFPNLTDDEAYKLSTDSSPHVKEQLASRSDICPSHLERIYQNGGGSLAAAIALRTMRKK